jgi:hypothetical protein
MKIYFSSAAASMTYTTAKEQRDDILPQSISESSNFSSDAFKKAPNESFQDSGGFKNPRIGFHSPCILLGGR